MLQSVTHSANGPATIMINVGHNSDHMFLSSDFT
jgi:hypothetical protein